MNSLVDAEQQHYGSRSNSSGLKQQFLNWRSRGIERKIERKSKRMAKKLGLDEVQRTQTVLLLRKMQMMRNIIREERCNSAVNFHDSLNAGAFDAVRVGRGIDSSVERVHFHMDDIVSTFTEWFEELDDKQKSEVSRFLRRRIRPFF